MDAFDGMLTHFQNFQIIVHRDCKFAVVPYRMEAHLNRNHQVLTIDTRKEIIKHVERLDHVAYTKEDVSYPAAEKAAIPELGPITQQCFQCKECGLLRETRKGMKAHCRKDHVWSSSKSREGRGNFTSRAVRNQPFIKGHYRQRFFKYAQWTKLFKVLLPAHQAQGGNNDLEAEIKAQKLTNEAADELTGKLKSCIAKEKGASATSGLRWIRGWNTQGGHRI